MISLSKTNDTNQHDLYYDANIRIVRKSLAAGPRIIKKALGNSERISRLKVEKDILARLSGVSGCPVLIAFDPARNELAMEDFGGIALDRSGVLGSLTLDPFLSLAQELARIIAAIHQRGVIHNDINPSNIVIRPGDMKLQVIDFDLSTTFSEERPDFNSRLLGTPAYAAPELTGRINRPVDHRADLYSLGASLYALATGASPFEETSPLELIHAHLTRTPVPPCDRAAWLPPRVSGLIMTLLAKEPDDRYQNASSVARDLGLLRQALARDVHLDRIILKERDIPLTLRPPRRLYGRDKELAILRADFENAAKGGVEGLFVTGYSGVGKTSLIHEIHRDVTLGNGFLASGKFEQYQRDRALSAPAQSLRQLCQTLLAESESSLAALRGHILAGIETPSILFDLIPELETLLGPQPAAPSFSPFEMQNHLQSALVGLIRRVASPSRPLALFLDDLQWADAQSLDLLAALLNEPDIHGLLLLGAYRDNEVDAAHPLMRTLRTPMAHGRPPDILALSNLALEDVSTLLADMLRMPVSALQPLASALYAKTGGNPYYAVEYLRALHRENILRPDPEKGVWTWDDVGVLMRQTTVNVVEFLVSGLTDLAPATAEALAAAAYLGTECDLGTLAAALNETAGNLAVRLSPALERGILFTPSAVAFHLADEQVRLRFCHDRMQQAATRLYDDERGMRLRLAMARRFFRAGADPANQFRAAEHFAAAAPLLADEAERESARSAFQAAAVTARRSGSFAVAEHFLRLGIGILPPDAWRDKPDAAFAMNAELHLALYCQSRNEEADAVYAALDGHAASPLQLVCPACVQIMSLSNRTRYQDAVRLGRELIGRLGMDMPEEEAGPSLERELERFYQLGPLERLANWPSCPTRYPPSFTAIARLVNRMIPAAFFVQPLLACWLATRSGIQRIEIGYHDSLNYSMACITLATVALRGDYATGVLVAEAALAHARQFENGLETARTQHVWALFNSHWRYPLETSIPHAREAFDRLLGAGEMEFACYTFFTSLAAMFDTCADIGEMRQEAKTALGFARKAGNRHGEDAYIAFRQIVRALEGKTERPGAFDDEAFKERQHLEAIQGNPMALCFFHIYRAASAALFDDSAALIRNAEAAAALTPYITGFYPTVLANAMESLALCRRAMGLGGDERTMPLERVTANQEWLAARAADAPMNIGHLYDLVEAERLDVLDRPWEALQAFEQAMRRAQANQRPWHAALSTERAGRFYLRRGLEQAGRSLLSSAHELYRQWGADGKASAMRNEFPFVGVAAGSVRYASASGNSSSGLDHDLLDYEALLSASRTLASETSLPQLVSRVVELVGQLTSATDVRFLLRDENGAWFLEGGVRGAERLLRMPVAEAEDLGIISGSAFRLALKMLKPLASDDAVIDARFSSDPHFANLSQCSLLALPILTQGRLGAFLILENRQYRAAFTAARTETASMLCGQLAASIENVRLYQSLERKVEERTRELAEANAKLETLSVTDGLTGLANRRRFDEVYQESWRQAARLETPFSVAMLDVDHFKAFNDLYGHQAGDACLQRIAAALKTAARRAGDLAARYGGEEFVLIFPGLPKTNAEDVCEKIRAAVENLGIPHAKNEGCGAVTVSIGVCACIPDRNDDPAAPLRQADASLYQAKSTGRNRVVGS